METTFTVLDDVTRILGELDKLHELHPEIYPDVIYEPFIKLVEKYKQVILTDSYDLDETNKLFEKLVRAGFAVMRRTEYNLIVTHGNINYALKACEYIKLEVEVEELISNIGTVTDLINGLNYPLRSYQVLPKDEINTQRLLEYAQGTSLYPMALETFKLIQETGQGMIIISYFDAIDSIREHLKQHNISSSNLDMDRLVIASYDLNQLLRYIILSQKYRAMNSIRESL